MTDKKAYEQKLRAQLDEWNAGIARTALSRYAGLSLFHNDQKEIRIMYIPLKLLSVVTFAVLALTVSGLYPAAVLAEQANEPTLKEQLEATSAGVADRLPPPVLKNIDDAIREVAESGMLDNAKKVGERAPDFELPDAVGNPVRLSGLLEEGPVILVWYRGNW